MKLLHFLLAALIFGSGIFAQKAKANKLGAAKPAAPAAAVAPPATPVSVPAVEKTREFRGKMLYVVGAYRASKLTYAFQQKASATATVEFPVEYERNVSEGGLGVGYSVFGPLFGKVYWGLDQAATYSIILSNDSKYRVVGSGAETSLGTFSQNTVSYNFNPLFGFQLNDDIGVFAGGGIAAHYQLAATRDGAKVAPSLDALYINAFATGGLHWLVGKVVISPQFRYDFYLAGIYNGAASSSTLSTGGKIDRLITAGPQFEIRLAVGYNFAQ